MRRLPFALALLVIMPPAFSQTNELMTRADLPDGEYVFYGAEGKDYPPKSFSITRDLLGSGKPVVFMKQNSTMISAPVGDLKPGCYRFMTRGLNDESGEQFMILPSGQLKGLYRRPNPLPDKTKEPTAEDKPKH